MFRILVVEDDINTRELMCAILRLNSFETLQAEDGVAALKLMDAQHVDLVILDLMMPNMDGYKLTKQLWLTWKNLPIIMVTAKQEPKDKQQRKLGTERKVAILEAVSIRLRPIMMTSLAMIFGMLPSALVSSSGSESRQPMAIAIIGG